MSQAQLLSLVGVLFALLVSLVGIIYRALDRRLERLEGSNNAAVLQSRVDALAAELSKLEGRFEQRGRDKDKFDYEWRHGQYVNDITAINVQLWPLATKMETVEKDLEGLREWKHLVVDPYVPGALNALKERVDYLQKRLNGQ